MLQSLLWLEKDRAPSWSKTPWPVAWCELDYGPTSHEIEDSSWSRQTSNKPNPKVTNEWNIEQAMRRALRNLEQRGLVELGRYAFMPYAEIQRHVTSNGEPRPFASPTTIWVYQHPDEHIPGRSRYMTGVLLTEKGRQIASIEAGRRCLTP
jgi:hypothetical protein